MFRCGVVSVLFLVIVSSVYAINFSPTVINLSSPAAIHYAFDGTDLKFDFTVTGKPVDLLFLVYTNGKSGEIDKIRNGYLGWHYINQIDT